MRSKPSLLLVPLSQVAWSVVLLCVLCPGLVPRGFAEDNPETSAWAIQVEPVQAEEGQLPPDFSMAVYENLIAQLQKTKKFQQVYRTGDHRADNVPNLLVLHMTLQNFEHGNQTTRAVTTVAGATKIKVHLKVTPRDGPVVVERDVQGTVRFFGENLKATYALAKDIAGVLRDTSLPGASKSAAQ